jgi:hypothetical protein
MWKKYGTAGQATDGNTIPRMRFACWITKATDTHGEYVIHITFPRQKWLRERAAVLRYAYTVCLPLSMTNKMQRYTIFFIAVNALHFSGGFSAHHQELKTVYTASGICQACLLLIASVCELDRTHASG